MSHWFVEYYFEKTYKLLYMVGVTKFTLYKMSMIHINNLHMIGF